MKYIFHLRLTDHVVPSVENAVKMEKSIDKLSRDNLKVGMRINRKFNEKTNIMCNRTAPAEDVITDGKYQL